LIGDRASRSSEELPLAILASFKGLFNLCRFVAKVISFKIFFNPWSWLLVQAEACTFSLTQLFRRSADRSPHVVGKYFAEAWYLYQHGVEIRFFSCLYCTEVLY
jgi:hypothetical protein